jgi:integrase
MLGNRDVGRLKVPADRRITVAQFVRSEWSIWLDEQVRFGNLKETTVVWRKGGAKRLVSEIGKVKLANVGKNELRGMLARRIEKGDSESVVRQLRSATRSVLSLAVDRDILLTDPSDFMTGPNAPRPLRPSARQFKAWSASEAQAFLQHAEGDRLEALWILLLGSGLRRGEALGLQWTDIDLTERTVSVQRSLGLLDCVPVISSPKTNKSKRVISVGSSVIDALRSHRHRQAQERLAAVVWGNEEEFVFTTATGEWLRPDYVTRRFKKLVAEAELPWIRLHGTRHTMASIALQNGTDIATVSERLGHRNTRITTEIYLHGSKESDRAAADAVDAALHG